MTKSRAQYILTNTRMGGEYRYAFRKACDMPTARIFEDGITEAEDRDVKAVWDTMEGWTNYAMALARIARGEA